MGSRFLIDTNFIIYYLDDSIKEDRTELRSVFNQEIFVSVITKIEPLGWRGISTEKTKQVELLLGDINLVHLNNDVILETIRLRKIYRIKLPDAIIAATAICYDLILVTNNLKDFKRISNLEVFNPL